GSERIDTGYRDEAVRRANPPDAAVTGGGADGTPRGRSPGRNDQAPGHRRRRPPPGTPREPGGGLRGGRRGVEENLTEEAEGQLVRNRLAEAAGAGPQQLLDAQGVDDSRGM